MHNNNKITDLFITIRKQLFRNVARIVPPSDVEDIVQETYVRVCQHEKKQTISYPKSYIFKTARNLALDFVTRAEAVTADSVESDDDYNSLDLWNDDPYRNSASNNEFAIFCQAVRQLPRQTRRTFVLKKVYGYSQKEIAERLGISESTVEKHISSGAKRCTRFMSKFTDYGKKSAASETQLHSLEKK